MKLHIKIALVVCCAALVPLLNSRAATFQVTVAPGGALTFSP